MKIDKQTMETYEIEYKNERIHIHSPTYISIKDYEITEDNITYVIKNENANITIWKDVKNIHIIIF